VRAQPGEQRGAITLSLLVRKVKVGLFQVENKEEWGQYKQRGIQEGPDGKRSGETSGGGATRKYRRRKRWKGSK
jgi:hypothetical protein